MRKLKMLGEVGVLQLPAVAGYDALMALRDILNRIDATSAVDILMKATTAEIESMYEQLAYDCTVDNLPLLGNEDFAFHYPSQTYQFIYEAAIWNFRDVWEKECVKLNHSAEFTPDETKLMPPFFSSIISAQPQIATWQELETYYSLYDAVRFNETLVVQSNNEHTASKKSGDGGSNSSSTESAPAPGSIAAAMAARGG